MSTITLLKKKCYISNAAFKLYAKNWQILESESQPVLANQKMPKINNVF